MAAWVKLSLLEIFHLSILFFTETYIINAQGFICGPSQLLESNGFVISPAFVRSRSTEVNCTWNIVVPDSFVRIEFYSFGMKGMIPSCEDEKIIFTERNNSSVSRPGSQTFCGTKLPAKFYSHSNILTITFKSTFKASPPQVIPKEALFSLGYQSVGWRPNDLQQCSPCRVSFVINDFINSPGYPVQYGANCQCEWLITVEKGYKIKFRFTSFQIEGRHGGECIDSVKIYDGSSANADSLGTFCGSVVPLPNAITTSSQHAFVTFYSDSSDQFSGFRLVYESELDEKDLAGLRSVAAILGGISFAMFAFLLLCSVVYKKYFGNQDSMNVSQDNELDPADDYEDVVQAAAPPSYQRVMADPEQFPRTPEITPRGTPLVTPIPSPIHRHSYLLPPMINANGSSLSGSPPYSSDFILADIPQSPPPPYPGDPDQGMPFDNINTIASGPSLTALTNPHLLDNNSVDSSAPKDYNSDDAIWQRISYHSKNRKLRKTKSSSAAVGCPPVIRISSEDELSFT